MFTTLDLAIKIVKINNFILESNISGFNIILSHLELKLTFFSIN